MQRGKSAATGTGAGRLNAEDYRLLAAFRAQLRRFLAFSEAAAREAGLAPQQHQALLAIKGLGTERPLTVGELAEHLAIRHHSAVGLVDRLVDAGYLKRGSASEDRRRVALILTSRGENVLARLSSAHRDELRRMVPLLKPLLAELEQ